MKTRNITTTNEIMYWISKSMLVNKNYFTWQNINNIRPTANTFLKEIDPSGRFIVIESLDEEFTKSIIKDFEIYLRGEFESLLFKSKLIRVSGQLIYLTLPEKIVAKENRKNNRLKFEKSKPKNVRCFVELEYPRKPRYFNFRLLDLSKEGIGFFISREKDPDLDLGREIYFDAIENDTLPKILIGTIVNKTKSYSIKMLSSELKGTRYGILWNEELSTETIDQLIKFIV